MADITVQYGNSTGEYDSPATLDTAGKLMSNDLILTATGGGGGSGSTDVNIIYATCGDNFGSGYTLTINCESEVSLEDIKDGTVLVCDFQGGIDSTCGQGTDGRPLTFDLCYNSVSIGLDYSQAYGYKNGHLTPFIYFENPTTAIFTYCAEDPQLPNVGRWELVGPNTADAMFTSYGICYTPPISSGKEVLLNDNDANGLVTNTFGGILISVNFYYPNTADNPTLTVAGDSERPICYGGWPITTGSEKYLLNGVCLFVLGEDYASGSLAWHLISTDSSSNNIYKLEFETLEFYTQEGGVWVDNGKMLWKIKDLPGLLTAIERGATITMNKVEYYDSSSNMDFRYDFNPATQIQKWKSIYVGANFSNYRPGSLVEDSSGSGTSHRLFEPTWESTDIVDEYILEPEIIIFDWVGSDDVHIDPSTGMVLYNLRDWIGG